MKTYTLTIKRLVEEIHTVEANSEEEAKELGISGESEFSHESETIDIEVTNIEEVE